MQVRSYPHVRPLQRLVPTQNSESPVAASTGALDLGGEGMPWVDRVLAAAGHPYGALSLPWRIDLR